MTDATRPIGDVLDGIGIKVTLEKDELVAGAIVLLKVIDTDGDARLSMAYSDGLSWIERTGMIHVAETMESRRLGDPEEP
ncbi:hypothetical protein [Streptomyces sp. NPDC094468]|uniref:hypothetical protein n=1 Tax=Streptomyces sp. NPDC094468 TaxID=3366066 RepID=UPI003814E36A